MVTIQAIAQQSVLTLSEEFKVKDKGWKDQYIDHAVHADEHFFTVTNSTVSGETKMKYVFVKLYDINYAITVSKFDKNMNPVKQIELNNGAKEFGPIVPEIFLFQNTPHIAYFKSADKASYTLYVAPINKNTLELGKPTKLTTFQQENVGIFKIEKILNSPHIFITQSPDNSKLMVIAQNDEASVESYIFDQELKLLKKSKIRITATDYTISNPLLTNDLVQCMLINQEGKTNLVCQSIDGKKLETKLFGTGDMYPNSIDTKISKDGKKIIIAASSIDPVGRVSCNGFLMYYLDCNNLQLSETKKYLYPTPFIESLKDYGAAIKEKKNIIVYNFLPMIVELENGNIAIVGSPERTEYSQSSYTSTSASGASQMRSTSSVKTYIGSLLVFFPDATSGTFTYSIVPRKFEFSKSSDVPVRFITIVPSLGTISKSTAKFIALNQGNEVAIFYNTLRENLNLSDSKKIETATGDKNLIIAETRINAGTNLPVCRQLGPDPAGKFSYFIGNDVPTNSQSIIFPIGKERLRWAVNASRDVFSYWCFINPNSKEIPAAGGIN